MLTKKSPFKALIPFLSIGILLILSLVLTYFLFLKNEIATIKSPDEPVRADTIFDSTTCILGTGACQLVDKGLQPKINGETKTDSKVIKAINSKNLDLKLADKKLEFIDKKLTPMSSILATQTARYYTLITADYPQEKAPEGFYQCAAGKDLGCAAEFIKVNPKYTTLSGQTQRVFPDNLLGTLRLTETKSDSKNDIPSGGKALAKHYYFTQRINGKDVYGSNFDVHVRDGKNVYFAQGRVTIDSKVPKARIDDKKLSEDLLRDAKKKAPANTKLTVRNKKTVIYNGKLLGYDDPNNDIALQADVLEDSKNPSFATNYVISKTTEDIFVESPKIVEALNREVVVCDKKCELYKSESKRFGSKNQDADYLFDWLGDAYHYFLNHFGRDSFDGKGTKISAALNPTYYCNNGGVNFDNAFYTGMGTMAVCEGVLTKSVVGHEFGHAVIHSEVPYIGSNDQTGALDEGIADWFSADMIGQWYVHSDKKIMRNLQDPGSTNQPDEIFSPRYYCGEDDAGGRHINTGPINLALYKAAESPPQTYDNETCEIQSYPPLGRPAVSRIVYRMLTVYMRGHDNFLNFFDDMNRACIDLYGNPAVCMTLSVSMRYTKLDKQIPGWPKSPVCYGQPEMTDTQAHEQSCQRQRAKRPPKERALPLPLNRKKDKGKKTKTPVGANKIEDIEGSWTNIPETMPLIQQIFGTAVSF